MFRSVRASKLRSTLGSGPPVARRRWGGALLTLCCVLGMASVASAAPSQTIVYSTDGGATWSTNVSLTPGQNFYVRQYNNNDTTDTINGVSVTTTLPTGFVRSANSTYVCINPSQGAAVLPAINLSEIACNDLTNAAGQGGPISEPAVWAGQNLTISPTANVYGTTPLNATNGPFAMGKKRYLNLHQCTYQDAVEEDTYVQIVRDTPNSDVFQTNTDASNTSDGTSATCGAGDPPGPGYQLQPVNTAAQALDLLARRYANLHDCDYYSAGVIDSFDQFLQNSPNPGGTFTAGTNSANTADTVAVCGAGNANYPPQPQNSGVAALDTLQNRYLNIHQCTFVKDDHLPNADHFTLIAPPAGPTSPGYTTGTNASDTADGSVVCGAGNPTYVPNTANMAVQAIDTLDQARGWQFVQYNVTAPTGVGAGGTYTQTGALTGGVTASDTGTITVSRPSPACLTAAQVRGCWHFDELTGTTAVDSSGNANNGTYLNGVTLGVGGVFMTAIQLDGVNDVVRVPDSNSLDVGDSFSLEGWVKRSAPASKTLEVFNKGANGFQLSVGNAASGSKVFLRKANVTTVATSTTGVPVDGNYHHIVATKSGSSVVFYIDGAVAGTTGVSLVQVIANTNQPLQFGEGNTAPVAFDEFSVYDSVLSAADVAARYAAGAV
jgi:hypothetical protein